MRTIKASQEISAVKDRAPLASLTLELPYILELAADAAKDALRRTGESCLFPFFSQGVKDEPRVNVPCAPRESMSEHRDVNLCRILCTLRSGRSPLSPGLFYDWL